MTSDTKHLICDTWGGEGGWLTFSQNVSSLALTVWERQCFGDIFLMDDTVSHLNK